MPLPYPDRHVPWSFNAHRNARPDFVAEHPYRVHDKRGRFVARFQSLRCAQDTCSGRNYRSLVQRRTFHIHLDPEPCPSFNCPAYVPELAEDTPEQQQPDSEATVC
jgi:hypothetical protein